MTFGQILDFTDVFIFCEYMYEVTTYRVYIYTYFEIYIYYNA